MPQHELICRYFLKVADFFCAVQVLFKNPTIRRLVSLRSEYCSERTVPNEGRLMPRFERLAA